MKSKIIIRLTIIIILISIFVGYITPVNAANYVLLVADNSSTFNTYWASKKSANGYVINTTRAKDEAKVLYFYVGSPTIYVKPGTFSLAMSIGNQLSSTSYDISISSPKSWTLSSTGNVTASISTYTYKSSRTWEEINFKNMQYGDKVTINTSSYGTFYVECKAPVVYFKLYKGSSSISNSSLSYTYGVTSSVSLSAKFTVDGSVTSASGVSWSSSNTSVASVNSSGTVTIKGIGTTKITASATYDSKSYSSYVTISVIAPNTSPNITLVDVSKDDGTALVTAYDDYTPVSQLEYGYSNTSDSSGVTNWQSSNLFTDLLGQYYFFVKDSEGLISSVYPVYVMDYNQIYSVGLVPPTKLQYDLNRDHELELQGSSLIVTLNNEDVVYRSITSDMLSEYDLESLGKQTINVNSYGFTNSFDIEVLDLEDIMIDNISIYNSIGNISDVSVDAKILKSYDSNTTYIYEDVPDIGYEYGYSTYSDIDYIVNWQTSKDFSGIPVGTYYFFVRDANNNDTHSNAYEKYIERSTIMERVYVVNASGASGIPDDDISSSYPDIIISSMRKIQSIITSNTKQYELRMLPNVVIHVFSLNGYGTT